ncbi:MAG TPA: DUF2252 domain-containing protein [Holophagaceae bacterium]|nr:DUF2252 domain-containing protein [Holophagaceae bacterium]
MGFRSIADRRAAGKALRNHLPRTELGGWKAPGTRPDLIPQLEAAVAGRQADLLPLRWGRMAQSPFRFYRGSAALLAADLGSGPTAGIEVGLCGDAHLLNLGAYADPEGRLVFDLNDFDEACRGPFEWDLWRLAASVVLAGREAGHTDARARAAVAAMAATWRSSLHRFAELPAREVARVLVRAEEGRKALAPVFAQAALDTPGALMAKAVEAEGSGARFLERPPLVKRLNARELASAKAALAPYLDTLAPERRQVMERYEVVDGSRRVLGCGSIGVLNWVLLFRGVSDEDPLFLEIKGTRPSCWKLEETGHRGRAVAEATRRLQTWADPFLGWTSVGGQPFLVRQWSDHKASIDLALLAGDGLEDYAALCGLVLAKAQARTGDPAMLAGYAGRSDKLDRALAAFATACADQVERDWRAFKAALARGELEAIEA